MFVLLRPAVDQLRHPRDNPPLIPVDIRDHPVPSGNQTFRVPERSITPAQAQGGRLSLSPTTG
jgi:hypothetical protein